MSQTGYANYANNNSNNTVNNTTNNAAPTTTTNNKDTSFCNESKSNILRPKTSQPAQQPSRQPSVSVYATNNTSQQRLKASQPYVAKQELTKKPSNQRVNASFYIPNPKAPAAADKAVNQSANYGYGRTRDASISRDYSKENSFVNETSFLNDVSMTQQ